MGAFYINACNNVLQMQENEGQLAIYTSNKALNFRARSFPTREVSQVQLTAQQKFYRFINS